MHPVDAPITQNFGDNPAPYQPDGHTGCDYGCPVGTPVRAIADGTVLWADWAQGLGWPNPYYIAIDFDGPTNGDQSAGIVLVIDHGDYISISAHLDQTGLNPGDTVTAGEIVAQTGSTGRSTGPHLHFEILPNGWDVNARYFGRVNPAPYTNTPTPATLTTTAKETLMAKLDLDDRRFVQQVIHEDADRIILDNRAQIAALGGVIAQKLGVDEKELAAALLASGTVTITPQGEQLR